MRVHLSLAAPDLAVAESFYTALLGPPDKRTHDYLRFAPSDVPIVLSLRPGTPPPQSGGQHLGLRLDDVDALHERWAALERAGVAVTYQGETECCYAGMERAWVTDPMGTSWEIYRITDDTPPSLTTPTSCCA